MNQNISVVLLIIGHSIKLVYNDKMLHGSNFLYLFTIITGNKFKRYELQKHIQTIGRNVKDLLLFYDYSYMYKSKQMLYITKSIQYFTNQHQLHRFIAKPK